MKKPSIFKTTAPKYMFAVFAHGGNIVAASLAFRKSEAIEKFLKLRPRHEWPELRHPKGCYQVKKIEVKLCP